MSIEPPSSLDSSCHTRRRRQRQPIDAASRSSTSGPGTQTPCRRCRKSSIAKNTACRLWPGPPPFRRFSHCCLAVRSHFCVWSMTGPTRCYCGRGTRVNLLRDLLATQRITRDPCHPSHTEKSHQCRNAPVQLPQNPALQLRVDRWRSQDLGLSRAAFLVRRQSLFDILIGRRSLDLVLGQLTLAKETHGGIGVVKEGGGETNVGLEPKPRDGPYLLYTRGEGYRLRSARRNGQPHRLNWSGSSMIGAIGRPGDDLHHFPVREPVGETHRVDSCGDAKAWVELPQGFASRFSPAARGRCSFLET